MTWRPCRVARHAMKVLSRPVAAQVSDASVARKGGRWKTLFRLEPTMNSNDQSASASSHKDTPPGAGKRWQFIVAYVLMAWPWIYMMYIVRWSHGASAWPAIHFIVAMAVSVGASLFVVRRRSLHVVAWLSMMFWCVFMALVVIVTVMDWFR